MFLRSNLRQAGLAYQDKEFHGEYWGCFDVAGNITGVLAHYWNGNIMMQSADINVLGELIDAYQKQALRPVAGIVGPDDQAMTAIRQLGLVESGYAINRAEGLYTLCLEALPLPAGYDFKHGEMVEAREVDSAILLRWIKAYDIEALGAVDDEALDLSAKNCVERIMKGGDRWVLNVNGVPVSMCGFNARLPEIVQIGPVWTPPEYRNRGYARALVALTLQNALKQNVQKAVLFTDNPAAAKAYEAIGFHKVGAYRLALLKQPVEIH